MVLHGVNVTHLFNPRLVLRYASIANSIFIVLDHYI